MNAPRTFLELLRAGRERLEAAGIEQPAWEAEQLLVERMGGSYAQLVMVGDREPKPEFAAEFVAWIDRRCAHEPLQHLLGHWPFLELDLRTDRRALIPRPETEDLVLQLRTMLPMQSDGLVVDVGTGGGCIALALAASHPRLKLIGIDVADEALALARENAVRTGHAERVTFLRGRLLEPLAEGVRAELIVANLPYVAPEEFAGLAPEVREHDPRSALVAADGGLALISALIASAPDHLRRAESSDPVPGDQAETSRGLLALEHAPGQTPRIVAALRHHRFTRIETHADRFGRQRFTIAS